MSEGKVHTALLSFTPLLDESDFSAQSHFDLLNFVLVEVFQKDFSNVVCLVGDNCSTNVALANICNKPLIGCAAHRFNLAVQNYLKDFHEPLLAKLNLLITKLRTLKNSGRLRSFTDLRPRLRCQTRWTGTYEMVDRYFALLPFIPGVAKFDDEVDELSTFNNKEVRQLNDLRENLTSLASVMLKLQSPALNLFQVRILFDGVITLFPEMEFHLGPNARIVHNPLFEGALIKLLRGDNSSLTNDEAKSIEHLLLPTASSDITSNESKSLADKLLGKYKCVKYLDVSFIPCGSVEVESLFSVASHVWNNRRLGTSPENIESYMFLKMNRSLWNENLVAIAIQSAKNEYEQQEEKAEK